MFKNFWRKIQRKSESRRIEWNRRESAFITNDDVDVSKGSIRVSWEGIRNSPRVRQDFDLIQKFRNQGIIK